MMKLTRHQARWIVTIVLAAMIISMALATASAWEPTNAYPARLQSAEALLRLLNDTDGTAVVSHDSATGVASFVRMPTNAPLDMTNFLPVPDVYGPMDDFSDEAKAVAFFDRYGGVFGITEPGSELALDDTATDAAGFTHLTYRQVYQGRDVFAGQLKVHFDQDGRITAANGTFIPDLIVDTEATLESEEAAAEAVSFVRSKQGQVEFDQPLTVANVQILVFRTGLIQGIPGNDHLAYEITVVDQAGAVREFVYVDARDGRVLDHYSGIHHALHRKIYERSISASNLKWEEGDTFPTGDADWNNEIDGAEETYNLFMSLASRDSYDGLGAQMITVNDPQGWLCFLFPNASWNGVSTNYCPNVTGDDTVAHEWGHAYTEFTHNLVYAWQSGALNESYSDIWGEVLDFINGRGTDSPISLRTNGACSSYGVGSPSTDNSYRWLSGEDDPAFGGAIRDMWRPSCYGDPDTVSASEYICSGATDNGGVHTNSGVPNRAFALAVDGDPALSITGIGLTKAAHIYWRAGANYQSAASDFVEHAAALRAACSDLTGINLPALSTSNPSPGLSGEMIAAADCIELDKAILAVELETAPSCTFQPLLDPNPPALCSQGVVSTISHEDWEGGVLPAGWSIGTRNAVAGFDVPQWSVMSGLPDGRAGYAAIGSDPNSSCAADDTGVNYLDSPSIPIPAGVITPLLAFDHWVATEDGYDGGNLKLSVNGGAFNLVPSSAFTFNAYNGSLLAASQSSNPLAGETAFNGSDGGTNAGSWVQSQVDLSGIAAPGDTIILRFELGTDTCSGKVGWYVDDVRAYSCQDALPPVISHQPVTETLAIQPLPVTATVTSSAPPLTVTLHYSSAGDSLYTELSMANTAGDSYSATIPAGAVITPTLSYYIEAADSYSSTTDGPHLVTVDELILPSPPILNAPIGVTFVTTHTYSWQESANALDYNLLVSVSGGSNVIDHSYSAAAICNGGVCSVTPSEVLAEDDYIWFVRASNSQGNTWSVGMNFVVSLSPPEVPLLIEPKGVTSETSHTYRWYISDNAQQYDLFVADKDGNVVFSHLYQAETICSGNNCSVTPVEALSEGRHLWYVRARNPFGNTWSAGESLTIFFGGPPTTPSLIAPIGVADSLTPSFSWAESVDALEYDLFLVNDDRSFSFSERYLGDEACNAGTCVVTPTLVLAEEPHLWYIRARNPLGKAWSAGGNFTVFLGGSLGTPVPLAPMGTIAETQPTYSWVEDTNALKYQLFVLDDGGATVFASWYTADLVCAAGVCAVTPPVTLTAGDHSWQLKANNPYGNAWGPQMNFTVAP